MMMKLPYYIIPLFVTLVCCTHQPTDEEQGRKMLEEARACYAKGNYTAARDTILSLRNRFPLALDSRREAILLLDSVELQEAKGDTLKEEFYRRKLQYDLGNAEINLEP